MSSSPTREMQGLSLSGDGDKTVSANGGQKEETERPSSVPGSPAGGSGEVTPRPAEPTLIPKSTNGSTDSATEAVDASTARAPPPPAPSASSSSPATVLARDMVHGSPSSPQVIKSPPSIAGSAGAASGGLGGMKSPPPRPGPGVGLGGGVGRGLGAGRTGLQSGMSQGGGSKLPPTLQAKIDAMATRSKSGAPAPGVADSTSTSSLLASAASRATAPSGGAGGMRPGGSGAPLLGGLAARRAASGAPTLNGAGGGLNRAGAPSLARPGGGAPVLPSTGLGGGPGRRLNRPAGMTLASMGGGAGPSGGANGSNNSPFGNFSKIVDPSGKLNFDKKAILHAEGVNFSNGRSFEINKDQMELQEELGKGNYGEVRKVYHKPTKVTMAMKEIRLELDQSKLNGIIMELDILHRAIAPEIIEFYGAFLVESCVYYCIEYMDAGSLDALNINGIPENELARITKAAIKGLKFLKDELQVMHRDVKPTNLLANKKGQIKLCDFGVSGQLEKSLAKTNIGCQSYMAPERIKGESTGQVSTYTVSSDVWSVGLTIIELAMGCYPYPPETYQNVFAQLQAIVHGPPPKLPDHYSATAQDFVASCLLKQPDARPTYAQLLEHPWMKEDDEREVDMAAWVARALDARANRRTTGAPVSSSAPEVAEGHARGPATSPPSQTANADKA